jgi:hypothetical protein
MADTPAPSPAPKKKQSPHEFDQQMETDLCVAETISAAATNALYQPTLIAAGLTAVVITAMSTNIATCRTNSSKAIIADQDASSLVIAEHTARTNLSNAIAVVRKAAKDKFAEGHPSRKKYFVGRNVEKTKFADLVQWLDELQVQLATDPLSDKGVSAAEVAAVTTTGAAWKTAHKAVDDKEREAIDWRTSRDQLHKQINVTRHAIQSAADRKWPHTDPANSSVRAKFKLPSDREFSG